MTMQNIIKAELKSRKIIYEDLAKALEININSVSQILNGHRKLSLEMIQKIADVMNSDFSIRSVKGVFTIEFYNRDGKED